MPSIDATPARRPWSSVWPTRYRTPGPGIATRTRVARENTHKVGAGGRPRGCQTRGSPLPDHVPAAPDVAVLAADDEQYRVLVAEGPEAAHGRRVDADDRARLEDVHVARAG